MNRIHAASSREHDERGAVLVTVVIVMLVGFVIAATIAASVMFTIDANAVNKENTSAFVAAESGRDVAIANLASAVIAGPTGDTIDCTKVVLHDKVSTGTPQYEYWVQVTDTADPLPAFDDDDNDLAGEPDDPDAACPTLSTKRIVIRSTGTTGGATTTVDAVYPWNVAPDTQPAGTLSYFDGEFKATKSTYEGDIVIRGTGDYYCNNSAGDKIQGDLWVLRAGVRVTGPCEVAGSIYSYGLVDIGNQDLKVGGDIVTLIGDISISAKTAEIGGSLYSGANVVLTKSGTVGGDIKARGSITTPLPTGWTRPGGAAIPPIAIMAGAPAPTITPTLDQVLAATAWIELGPWNAWATDATVKTGLCTGASQKSILESPGQRVVFDLTGCGSKVDVAPGMVSLMRDVLYLVPAASEMNVDLSKKISNGAGDPQLFIVHSDTTQNSPTVPSPCPAGADKLDVGTTIGVRTMIYSPCGITNTMSLTMIGQLYMGGVGLHLNGGTFDCEPMDWKPVIPHLSCGVKGTGGIYDPNRKDISMGSGLHQMER